MTVRIELTRPGRNQAGRTPGRPSPGQKPSGQNPPGRDRSSGTEAETAPGLFRQPRAVWAMAFACVVAFMGIGLVDPILPAISSRLHASPSQAMWLFTSYLVITGLAMFFTSAVSSRLGTRTTLLIGLVVIVVFATAAGASGSVWQIIGFRAGWGLGNALFISTALAGIVGAASGGVDSAIILYEAAMGLGLATGPLVGGALGSISWRGPFVGTAVLMAIGLIAIAVLLPRAPRPAPVPLSATLSALRHPVLMTLAVAAVFYNYGFFALLAYSPFPLEAAGRTLGLTIGAQQLGLVFFGWGLCLALTSVFAAEPLVTRLGRGPVLTTALVLLAVDLATMGLFQDRFWVLVAGIVVGGLLLGVMNTVLTQSVMESTDLPRSVASSTYSGVRFLGGAASAAVAGPIAVAFGPAMPYWVAAVAFVLAAGLLLVRRDHLAAIDRHVTAADVAEETADERAVVTAAEHLVEERRAQQG